MINGVDIFALLGYPLGHSYSPEIHNTIYKANNINAVYTLFEVADGELENAVKGIKALGIKGVNVTIPYKEKIIGYLDVLNEEALKIGAVNTIKNEHGILKGYNTDYYGFKGSLEKNDVDAHEKDVFVIGSGGASKPVILCLLNNGCSVHLFARDENKMMDLKNVFSHYGHIDINYLNDINENIKKIKPFMLVNCTPVGIHGYGYEVILIGKGFWYTSCHILVYGYFFKLYVLYPQVHFHNLKKFIFGDNIVFNKYLFKFLPCRRLLVKCLFQIGR